MDDGDGQREHGRRIRRRLPLLLPLIGQRRYVETDRIERHWKCQWIEHNRSKEIQQLVSSRKGRNPAAMEEHGGRICPPVTPEYHRAGQDGHPRRENVCLVAPDFAGPAEIRSRLINNINNKNLWNWTR